MSKKILIVEDEISLRTALCDKFRKEGFSILEAKNGQEGLAVALKEHPDLILADILMPVMGGLDMIREIRKDDWGKSVHIIITSNLSEMDKVNQALESNVFEYLVKSDAHLNDMVDKVKRTLNLV